MKRFATRPAGDSGAALISALLVGVILTTLGMVIARTAASSFRGAIADRGVGVSLGGAEAGLARGLQYLRVTQPRELGCSPTCTANPWGNAAAPQSLTFPDGSVAKVYIKVVQPFSPPKFRSGTYIIHSVGTGKGGVGMRTLEQTVSVAPLSFPLGVYTDQQISFQGNGAILNESVFSRSCIDSRGKPGDGGLSFDGIDSYYGIPAAPHTTSFITPRQVNNCSPVDRGSIHGTNPTNSTQPCNATQFYMQDLNKYGSFVYDQSGYGGDFTAGDACSTAPNQYTTSSKFTLEMLQSLYGFKPRGLTPEQYDALKQEAIRQGTYYTTPSPPTWPSASTSPYPILYFKIGANQTVKIQNDLSSYLWQNDPTCTMKHPSVVIVVEGGSLHVTGSTGFTGAIFTPDGETRFDGSNSFVGTIFAKQFTAAGGDTISLNDCYAQSTSPLILEPKPLLFRQVDS